MNFKIFSSENKRVQFWSGLVFALLCNLLNVTLSALILLFQAWFWETYRISGDIGLLLFWYFGVTQFFYLIPMISLSWKAKTEFCLGLAGGAVITIIVNILFFIFLAPYLA